MNETEKVSSDTEYQSILTQRSVARAALHLGIETLPENTLTVLQDSLTHYLERVGRVLGRNVENGGRSSDHVNVLDALRAVEDCGLRAGGVNMGMKADVNMGMNVGGGMDMASEGVGALSASASVTVNNAKAVINATNGGGAGSSSGLAGGGGIHGDEGWIGLAKFLYGPNFEAAMDKTGVNGNVNGNGNGSSASASASSNRNGHMMNGHHYGQMRSESEYEEHIGGGWNAPLDDYDSLPLFPVQTVGTSSTGTSSIDGDTNAAAFSSRRESDSAVATQMNGTGPQGDDNSTKNAADAIAKKPTDGGTTGALASSSSAKPTSISPINNGNVSSGTDASKQTKGNPKVPPTSKRKRDEKETPAAKRTKVGGDGSSKATMAMDESEDTTSSRPNDDDNASSLPSYIPKYLPPFPPRHTYAESSSSSTVPIHIPAHPTTSNTNDDPFNPEEIRLSLVQLGRQSYWGSMSTKNDKKDNGVFARVSTSAVDVEGIAAGQQKVVESVKPVARASNARISRILEGSMDVHS